MDNREAVARALYKFGCENVVGGEDCPFEEQDPETYEITIGLADAAISAMGQAQVKPLTYAQIEQLIIDAPSEGVAAGLIEDHILSLSPAPASVEQAARVLLENRYGGYGNRKAMSAMWEFVYQEHGRHMLPQSHYDGVFQAGLKALSPTPQPDGKE